MLEMSLLMYPSMFCCVFVIFYKSFHGGAIILLVLHPGSQCLSIENTVATLGANNTCM
jgi:hypothetical protein